MKVKVMHDARHMTHARMHAHMHDRPTHDATHDTHARSCGRTHGVAKVRRGIRRGGLGMIEASLHDGVRGSVGSDRFLANRCWCVHCQQRVQRAASGSASSRSTHSTRSSRKVSLFLLASIVTIALSLHDGLDGPGPFEKLPLPIKHDRQPSGSKSSRGCPPQCGPHGKIQCLLVISHIL